MDNRLGTSNRLQTGSRPIGTANKPMGLRMGTANKNDPNYQPVGMNANIKIFDRPVTTHGIAGIQGQPKQGGRIIQDRSYFMGVLRQ